jgi:hypothetical protein
MTGPTPEYAGLSSYNLGSDNLLETSEKNRAVQNVSFSRPLSKDVSIKFTQLLFYVSLCMEVKHGLLLKEKAYIRAAFLNLWSADHLWFATMGHVVRKQT